MAYSEIFLLRALQLAKIRQGFCAPNPAVGAVVVKNNKVIAEGYHLQAGAPHAEVMALSKLTAEAITDSDVYVSLEPCCHFGRTPPCTDLLIKQGVRAVYYGFPDPNPLVAGKGEQKLLAAGIHCQYIPNVEIDQFYQSYAYWTQHRKPFVTLKLAMSLNGKIAASDGSPLCITGPEAALFTHQNRKQTDVILTTCNTIIADDPQLNVRLNEEVISKPVYILDSRLELPLSAKIWQSASKITLFHQSSIDIQHQKRLLEKGANCIQIGQKSGKLCLNEVLTKIGGDGVHALWVEAGGECAATFLAENLVNRALFYIAPKWFESAAKNAFNHEINFLRESTDIEWNQLGMDVVLKINYQ